MKQRKGFFTSFFSQSLGKVAPKAEQRIFKALSFNVIIFAHFSLSPTSTKNRRDIIQRMKTTTKKSNVFPLHSLHFTRGVGERNSSSSADLSTAQKTTTQTSMEQTSCYSSFLVCPTAHTAENHHHHQHSQNLPYKHCEFSFFVRIYLLRVVIQLCFVFLCDDEEKSCWLYRARIKVPPPREGRQSRKMASFLFLHNKQPRKMIDVEESLSWHW